MRNETTEARLKFTPMDKDKIEELEEMDRILRKADRVLGYVTADLTEEVSPDRGRNGMTAEQVLRMALVKRMYDWSYERLYDRVHDSIALRRFCCYEFEMVPKPSTLQENIKKLRAETFEAVNRELLRFAKRERIEDGRKIRVDTTGVETDIHHPSDSRLLEDAVRVITRLLVDARRVFPRAGIEYHNRTRVVKKRVFAIANAKGPQKRKRLYEELMGYGREVLGHARAGVKRLRRLEGSREEKKAASLVAVSLKEYADFLAKIVNQTMRRVIDGESVPAAEKVVSIFEPHTDIIKKGGRETLFGHKVCFTAGRRSLVLDCMILKGNPADATLYGDALDRHRKHYGYAPEAVATDSGFASVANAEYARAQGVKEACFSRPVGEVFKDLEKGVIKILSRFRAGVEGIISTLKRAVGLGRCLWKGFESFESYVWSGLVANNLKRLTEILVGRRRKRAFA